MKKSKDLEVRSNDFGMSHAKESLRKFKNAVDKNLPILLNSLPKPIKTDLKEFILTGSVEDLKQSFPNDYPDATFKFNLDATGHANEWNTASQSMRAIIKTRRSIKPNHFTLKDNLVKVNDQALKKDYTTFLNTDKHLDYHKRALKICKELNKNQDFFKNKSVSKWSDIKCIGLIEYSKGEFKPNNSFIYNHA